MYDVVVAGAGPAGSFVAGKCAGAGLKTLVVEEHSQIGVPIHCTGIVSDSFISEFSVPECLIQKRLENFKILGPLGRVIQCPENVKANVIYRKKFDDYLADNAIRSGASYRLSTRATEIIQDQDKVTLTITREGITESVTSRVAVLATGSMSELPYRCGIGRPHDYLGSLQVNAEIEKLEGVELYLGNHYAPGSFAYAVSINGTRCKIGLIVKNEIKTRYRNLIESPFLGSRIVNIEENHLFRRIPIGFPSTSVERRIIAVGDAAGQVKTTTGGGIYYGLLCARILTDQLLKSRCGGDFDLRIVHDYDRLWKKKIIKELRAGMLFRKFLESISDQDISAILGVLEKEGLLTMIRQQADFDFHQKLILALLKVPELHRIVFALLKKNLRIF